MADNVNIASGDDPALLTPIATDEISGAHYQAIKVVLGGDGANNGFLSASNPLPVTGALSDAELRASPVSVSGPLTDAQLRASAIPVTGGLTDAQLRASAVSVDLQGELIEAVEALRMAVHSLTRSIGQVLPDASGRQRVLLDAITASLTLNAVATVTTVSTVSTVSNQTSIGAFSASEHIPSLMRMTTDGLRSNIVVT